jgi:glycerate dehydrogenase
MQGIAHHIVYLEADSMRAVLREPTFPHTWDSHPQTAPVQIVERLRDATIAIVNKAKLDAGVLAQLPKLQLIAVAATGTDAVDLDWCRAHGLPVCNIRGYAAHTVPEHVFMLLLALRRQLLAYRADVAAGKWQQAPMFCFFDHPIRDLHGSTLGIMGRGSLGQGVARLAEAFGMRVLWGEHKHAASIRPGYVPFAQLLAESDAITLHCPLTAETRGMIGTAELAAMKPTALLINTARGGLVDEAALVDALRAGRIGGAGFDVLSAEPPRDGNPLLELDQPNFILMPHVAWASDRAMQALADQLIDNLEAFVRGEERNRVA